jgi:hypothetical protein
MTSTPRPEPNQKWARNHWTYIILDVSEETVTMREGLTKRTVEETRQRFDEEVAAGRAVLHPECTYCGLPVDPDEGRDGPLHYECWFEQASVRERCDAEADRAAGNRLATEALRSETSPRDHLLAVIGDPARTLHDRNDAELLLASAVSTREVLDAQVRCPSCREGEVFPMDPATGEVRCHCGEMLKPAD